MPKPNIIFVGNGDMQHNLSKEVERAHCVVRSQKCGVNYQGKAGHKTNILCLRPDNEPFGKELAREKLIPRQAADECDSIIMVVRHKDPKTSTLFANYPMLKYKPLLMLNEQPARELLLSRGAADKKQHKSINPTLGMVVLHYWIVMRQLYLAYNLQCIGFSWDFGKYKEHHPDIEQQIQQEWATKGWLEFLQ